MAVDAVLNELSERVIGAAIELHRHLGSGFLESTYEKALAIELELRGIPFAMQVPVQLRYKDRPIGDGKIDLLIDQRIIVKLKAIAALTDAHKSQVLAYLKATGLTLGLLINFHEPVLAQGVRRIAN